MRMVHAGKVVNVAVATAIGLMALAVNATTTDDKTKTGASKVLELNRGALHTQAVKESLAPIRPGIRGKQSFWNSYATAFMYAPAFDFEPIKGAKSYRFTATAYGTKSWSFDAVDSSASLAPVWGDLPEGTLLVEMVPLDDKGNVRWPREDLRPGRWLVKEATAANAPPVDFDPIRNASKYRFTVWAARNFVFEADEPWASLNPIWIDVPVGEVVLKVDGLDRKGGKAIGPSKIAQSPQGGKKNFRLFHRRAVFNGPYHAAAMDYTEGAYNWLRWLADRDFKRWNKEAKPGRLSGYPGKFVGAAIAGMTDLAAMETDPRRRKEDLRMAGNAARALIAASFPSDWGLAYFPPTYSDKGSITTVMTKFPASVGMAYLDYYEATGDRQILEAATRIADTYRKAQLASGSWPLRMDGRTGEAISRTESETLPYGVVAFLDRLIGKHGFDDYRPVLDGSWRWIKEDTLATFRFEGQFEDTSRGGGRRWNLSHYPATNIARYLLLHSGEDPSYVAIAEEALRFAEDQFVIWEQPVVTDAKGDHFPRAPFTPWVLEQYVYMVPISASAADMMEAYSAAYEATGKELYLAKAITIANAMTVLLKKNGGRYVGTYWNSGSPGGWPNVHRFSAKALAGLGEMLRKRNLQVLITDRGAATGK